MNFRPKSNGFSLSTLENLSRSEKIDLLKLLKEQERRTKRNKIITYKPYPKQLEFHAKGITDRERLLMAGNQLGKTMAGAAETALHLTGRYEEWEDARKMKWPGRRFDKPVRAWAGSNTNELTRDGVQKLLIGEPKIEANWGTGFIPGDCLMDTTRRSFSPRSSKAF